MKPSLTAIALFFLLTSSTCFAQGFQPPAQGKAAIYFVRLAAAGFAIPFDFYDKDKFIGAFAGKNYMRYEADPGEHLFWAASENHEFLTADLTEGGIYVVVVDVEMGIAVARVGLSPLRSTDRLFERAKKLVDKKTPKIPDEEKVSERNESRQEYIHDTLGKYEEKWKEKRSYKHLSADMALPINL